MAYLAPSSGSAALGNYSGIGLSNTVYSDVAPCLPLPSLPVFCGGASDADEDGRSSRLLSDVDILAQSNTIAELLRNADVSYLNLKEDAKLTPSIYVEPSDLYEEIILRNPDAFECSLPGRTMEQVSTSTVYESKPVQRTNQYEGYSVVNQNHHQERALANGMVLHAHYPPEDNDMGVFESLSIVNFVTPMNFHSQNISTPAKKPKLRKKVPEEISAEPGPSANKIQDDIIGRLSELLEDFCSRAEISGDDRDEAEWLSMPISDLRILVNEIMSIYAKKLLNLVPADILFRLLKVLDHQIHRAEGLSVDRCNNSDSEAISHILCALESIHIILAVMAHSQMPKHLYSEEIIERMLEFSRHQMMDVMCIFDPSYRNLHRPVEQEVLEGDDDEDAETDVGFSKKRGVMKNVRAKTLAENRVSAVASTVLQKLCTVLDLLKDMLLTEKLSDSCILQLVKTNFTTFVVDNVQLLQLKAIALISSIFYAYPQHRTYIMDEMLQMLWKLPSAKRVIRAYHLPDEDQRQIQMITALLIQLVQCSANIPEVLRHAYDGNVIMEIPNDATYLNKCHEAVTEACCLFWTRILQRFASVKNQDASEIKVIMENLVVDLLTTLNLPEYPASAPILEVFCVLLLQNAGLKSKDISARSMAIDLLGSIAARLKQDAVICQQEKFCVLLEVSGGDGIEKQCPLDVCSLCLDGKVAKSIYTCQSCQKVFHADCMAMSEHDVSIDSWTCQFCVCKRQLSVLQSYCKSQYKDDKKNSGARNSEQYGPITNVEIAQQLLLNYLQESSLVDDVTLFVRWFYLCLWCKDDPNSQQKFYYYLARLKSKMIVRNSTAISTLLKRGSIKKINLALGRNNSFSRGFDKILHMLLASLKENSPVIRAKALRAVSIIVEADPEVLRDKRVQLAVEGRFCDSAISVREAALELVGRHIASHPDVGLQYFEKIAERIKDTGVSVRKRAIKIIRDMCASNVNFSVFTSACIEIIVRISDDESSIQDLVCKTFYDFWFEEPTVSQTKYYSDGNSVSSELARKTEQIVEMLRRMPNYQLLVTVIKRNLALDFFPQSAKASGINPVLLASVRRRCELMCKCLLEKILQVEESSDEEVEMKSLPYVLVLHAFCVVDPSLCAPASDPSQFLVTLQPYLKSQTDNRVIAQLVESIIFIIDAVLPLLRKLPQSVIEELEQDLKNMILRHSFLTVVHACIKCLCSLSKISGKGYSVIEYLIQVFLKQLDSQGDSNKQLVGRSLFCLGLLIRYGNALLSCTSSKNSVARSVSLFKKYLNMEDFALKIRSLQALGFVLIARPEIMLDEDVSGIVELSLSDLDLRLRLQALQNMYEYLLDAEKQMGTAGEVSGSQSTTESRRSVPVAAGAGDTNICGGIIQLYWEKILDRCLDVYDQARQTALKIVEIVLRQGLVHPITCVPYLIALETDPHESNSKLAHHLLLNMNEKYPAFFESRLGDGLQMSFIFVRTMTSSSQDGGPGVPSNGPEGVKGKSDAISFAQARLGVSRIYKLIRGNRASRNKFMSSIVRKFDGPVWNDTVVPFLMHCTEVLASLPFTSPDEPLYLIYTINRVIQVRTGAIEANMKAFCSRFVSKGGESVVSGLGQQPPTAPYLYSNMDPVDLNGMYQELPYQNNIDYMTSLDLNGNLLSAQMNQFDSSRFTLGKENVPNTDPGGFSGSPVEELSTIKVDCLGATALRLLLILKRHLKIVYSLNDERCQTFSPNDPLKPGDVLSKQNIAFTISGIRTDLPNNAEEVAQQYQEFKSALKEDTLDYSAYTANIKPKRPASRRGPRRTSVSGIGDDNDDCDDNWSTKVRINSSGGRRVTRSRMR